MANTLVLDVDLWDLIPDAAGNIAMATEPYAQAQDAASAIRTFQGELWFDTEPGLPYYSEILGNDPPMALLKERFEAAALTVPGVETSNCVFTSTDGRTIQGRVEITNTQGVTSEAAF